jgi:hypothetical protein
MKRNRSDSAASAVKAMVNAALPDLEIPPHVTLSEGALKFWPGITRARAREEWRDVDLVVAAQLAECQALIEQESASLREEGTIQTNDRGTKVENPRNRVIQNLATREMALMRTLLMGGKAGGDARNFAGARKTEAAARRVRKELEDDELLAT